MPGTGFRSEIIVYVLIAEVKSGMVYHPAFRTAVHDFSRSLASRLVAVQEKINGIIALQERNGLFESGNELSTTTLRENAGNFLMVR